MDKFLFAQTALKPVQNFKTFYHNMTFSLGAQNDHGGLLALRFKTFTAGPQLNLHSVMI